MEAIQTLKKLLELTPPVDFRTFVTSPDYCGTTQMYEYWLSKGESIGKPTEIILDGSLGGGKSWFAAYYIVYRLYCLFQQGSPQRYLGLADDTDIYILYFSVSREMAKRSGFNYIYSVIESCKWFKDNAPINTELKSSVEFVGKHVYITHASAEGHAIGLNVWGFILDEANFRNGVGNGTDQQYSEVTQLYEQLLDRQLSRYARPDGSVEALAILVSSASYQSSFLERRKSVVKDSANVRVITSTSYDTNPAKFSKERFRVFIGAGAVSPQIITSEDQEKKVLQQSKVWGTGQEESFFRMVPINLRESFERNIVLALQNHCGVPTNMSSSFMSNMKFLYDSYVNDIKPIFQSFQLEASTADDTQLIEYLLEDNIEFSERPHSIFIDASVQHDTASIVCFRFDGKSKDDLDYHTKVFSLKLIPPAFPHQTKLSKIKDFIIDLSSYLNIVAVGSDNFQSIGIRQDICSTLGLQDIRLSIDSSDIPHFHWMQALTEGRIRQVREELLEKEVREAIHDWKRHRVVKATNSSDDCLQGNVGAFYLSDTIGKETGSIEDLYPCNHINLVNQQAFQRMLIKTGYKQNIFKIL